VAKERLGSARARLFVALGLPEDVRDGLEAWQAKAISDPMLRPVPPENLHVTLCFLGGTPERRIADAVTELAAIEPRPVGLRLEPEIAGKPPKRPRVLAVEAPSDAGTALAGEVCERFNAARLYRPERRDFWSHVTVARVRSRDRSARLKSLPGPLPEPLLEPFEAVRLTLYRSNLRSQGAEYVPLATLDLPSLPEGGTKKE
jgi:RNA 2',3'-cyclic 3'-phosphodiesterase